MTMDFRKARADELDVVCSIYRQVCGLETCTWNEYYPTIAEAQADFDGDGLYVLCIDGQVAGAATVVADNELDDIKAWRQHEGARELARLVLGNGFRGKGYSNFMVEQIIAILKAGGYKAIHLGVAQKNIPALKTYVRHGFEHRGQEFMYGAYYQLYELVL